VYDEHGSRPKSLQDQYAEAERLKLSPSVPMKIAAQFNSARELLVFAWFNVRFAQIAERHAYSTVEMALRERLATRHEPQTAASAAAPTPTPDQTRAGVRRRPRPGLAGLLRMAIEQGLISDDAFRHYHRLRERQDHYYELLTEVMGHGIWAERPPRSGTGFVESLAKSMPPLRNTLSHGSTSMYPGVCLQMELCCDLINELYAG
jgi:hypothetical protein